MAIEVIDCQGCHAVGALIQGVVIEFVRGDCTDDGIVNVADAIWLLSFLFEGNSESPCAAACDANDDGGLDVGDPIYILNAQFSGGPLPLPPFPDCGTDPTDDTLGCLSFSVCP